MSEVKVILASGSPRRRHLLELIGIQHEVRPSNIDEKIKGKETPRKHAERLAREKASVLAKTEPDSLIIAADTIVVINGKILGKPANAVDAGSMLTLLNGRNHTVITAVAVARGAKLKSGVEEVHVKFRKLTEDEIDAYIATGEPMDKAGAYGIQGFGATIVERIEGDYFAVMGLPIVRLVRLLAELGVDYRFGKVDVKAVKRAR